ncbi:MAG TPA: hypothetical protein PKV02_03740 [Bacteroidia bacterium]|nr:hypothetical protein [Bacteroidia bacterium]
MPKAFYSLRKRNGWKNLIQHWKPKNLCSASSTAGLCPHATAKGKVFLFFSSPAAGKAGKPISGLSLTL